MRYSITSLGTATAIWAAASLLCTTALQSTAQADPVPLESATLQGDEVIETPIGDIELVDNYISDDAIQRLFDEMDYQRAAQAYIWATPAVSFRQWQVAQEETFGAKGLGDFVVYNTLGEKRGIVTANLTTPYVINFVNLAEGPIFVEVPAAPTAGMFLDAWQRPVSDIGQTGPDQAQGGTYMWSVPSTTRRSTRVRPTSWSSRRRTTSCSESESSIPRPRSCRRFGTG